MNLQVLHEEHQKIWLHVTGVPVSYLNAVRRAVISDLPGYAIERVDFYENTSAMFNEYLANRLGLLPMTYEEAATGDVLFSLDVEGVEEDKTVYSGDLVSQDANIKPFYTHIPLIKLGKGQRLRFEATARVGSAKEHARFQNAVSSYGHLEEYKLVEACKKCQTPMKIRESALVGKIQASKLPDLSCVCEDCETKVEPPKKSDSFILFIESYNNLSARQQLFRALTVLEQSGKKIVEGLKS